MPILVSVGQILIFWIYFKMDSVLEISICHCRRVDPGVNRTGVWLINGIKLYESLVQGTEGNWAVNWFKLESKLSYHM
jgi:hypothetical protein